jgi:hypothetical protein
MWPRSVFWVVGQYAALYTFYPPGTSNVSRGLPVSSVYALSTMLIPSGPFIPPCLTDICCRLDSTRSSAHTHF